MINKRLFSKLGWLSLRNIFRDCPGTDLFLNVRVALVVSVSASHMEGHRFPTRPGHTKDQQKMVQTTSLQVTDLYCFHYVVLYSIFVSLFFPIEISVIKNSQIDAKICALSYKTKSNIGQPCQFFAMG